MCELNVWIWTFGQLWIVFLRLHPSSPKRFLPCWLHLTHTRKKLIPSLFLQTKTLPPWSPLILSACQISDENEAVASYISAVMCGLLLCQRDNLFATTLLPFKTFLLKSSVEDFFQSWSGNRPINSPSLGLSHTSSVIFPSSLLSQKSGLGNFKVGLEKRDSHTS